MLRVFNPFAKTTRLILNMLTGLGHGRTDIWGCGHRSAYKTPFSPAPTPDAFLSVCVTQGCGLEPASVAPKDGLWRWLTGFKKGGTLGASVWHELHPRLPSAHCLVSQPCLAAQASAAEHTHGHTVSAQEPGSPGPISQKSSQLEGPC